MSVMYVSNVSTTTQLAISSKDFFMFPKVFEPVILFPAQVEPEIGKWVEGGKEVQELGMGGDEVGKGGEGGRGWKRTLSP